MAVLGGGDWAGVVAGLGQVEQAHWSIVWEQGDCARRLGQEEQVIGLGEKTWSWGARGLGQEQADLARSRETWPGGADGLNHE
jgi:hypothetical protein